MSKANVLAKDFFLALLMDKMDPECAEAVRLRHPFAAGEIDGWDAAYDALERLASSLASLKAGREYHQPGCAACCWDAEFEGRSIRGVTAVTHSDAGIEATVTIGSYPAAKSWRERVLADCGPHLRGMDWEPPAASEPPEAAPESDLDPKLPFAISPNVVFHSPILAKPVCGRELVTRVFAHTSAIYGDRIYGPRIQAGPRVMSFWEASVSGFMIRTANEIRFGGNREAEEMSMSMQPWPVVELFRGRCLERTRHFLDQSYFGP